MKGRAAFYRLFSTIFKKPPEKGDMDFILRSAEYCGALAEESGLDELKSGSQLFCNFSENAAVLIQSDEKKFLKELNIAYTTLFLLGHVSVRYTESSFFSSAGLWKQEEWAQVKEIYRQNGFTMPENFREPEDHIAMELLFMSALSHAAAQSIENEDSSAFDRSITVQYSFLNDHLLKWVPGFCDQIVEKSTGIDPHHFYRSSAMLLKGYVTYDRMVLGNFVQA